MDELVNKGLAQGRALQNQPMTGDILSVQIDRGDGTATSIRRRFSAPVDDEAAMAKLREEVMEVINQ